MTDTVLQSFCERCGTRYTFTEQDTRRESGLSKLGRSLGLRGASKPPGEPTVATALPTHDPFRATFHFCLECRQYTCQSCWNADAGYCQTCYPLPEVDLQAAERAASAEAQSFAPAGFAPPAAAAATATGSAWPTTDLDRASRGPAPDPVVASGIPAAAEDVASPWGPAVVGAAAAPLAEPALEPGPAPEAGAGQWADGSPEVEAAGAAQDEMIDPWGGQDSIAAAILRGAGSPSTVAPAAGPVAVDELGWDDGIEGAVGQDVTDEAAIGVQDPWRGVVFSDAERDTSTDVRDLAAVVTPSPAAPDPELPWLAAATLAAVETVEPGAVLPEAVETVESEAVEPEAEESVEARETTEVVEVEAAVPAAPGPEDAEGAGDRPDATMTGSPEADEGLDVDHRGWIAASTIASGTGWSTPMRTRVDDPENVTTGWDAPDAAAHVIAAAAIVGDPARSGVEETSVHEDELEVADARSAPAEVVASDEVVAGDEAEAGDIVRSAADGDGTADAAHAVLSEEGERPAGTSPDADPWPSADARPPLDAEAQLEPHVDDASAMGADASAAGIDAPDGVLIAAAAESDAGIDSSLPEAAGEAPSTWVEPASDLPPSPWPPTAPPSETERSTLFVPVAAAAFASLPPDDASAPGDAAAPAFPPPPPVAPAPPFAPPPPPAMPAYASAAPATPVADPPIAPPSPLAPPPPMPPPYASPAQASGPLPLGATAAVAHVMRPTEHALPPQPPPPPPPLTFLPPQPGAFSPPSHPAHVAPPPHPAVRPPAPVAGLGGQGAPAAAATAAASGAKARPCHSCALPLSAKARFCRRCGAQQAA